LNNIRADFFVSFFVLQKALKLKLELSEKTQKLIEEQIKQQKILLGKIDQVKSNEEKLEILEVKFYFW
jgi:hypothetical protein